MKIIYVVGAPKSGNTWISRLLGDALNSPIGGAIHPRSGTRSKPLASEGEKRHGDYIIYPEHMAFDWSDGSTVVYIYRDPRDVIVSAYYYWGNSTMDHMVKVAIKGGWPYRGGWKPMMDLWYTQDNADFLVSYEELLGDAYPVMYRILSGLGEKIHPKNIRTSIENQSFSKRTSMNDEQLDRLPYGRDVQKKLMRKGIVGDWKNHLNQDHCKFVHDECYELMNELGYENDPDWWKKI